MTDNPMDAIRPNEILVVLPNNLVGKGEEPTEHAAISLLAFFGTLGYDHEWGEGDDVHSTLWFWKAPPLKRKKTGELDQTEMFSG